MKNLSAFRLLILAIIGIMIFQSSIVQAASSASKGWKAIAVGTIHSLAIKMDGTAWQWGDITTYGAEGTETNLYALVPEQVPVLQNVIAVAAGQVHSLALQKDGTVWAWGGNDSGQLGNGNKESLVIPHKVEGISDVVAIEADWTRSFAVKSDGTVWGWGGFYFKDAKGNITSPDRPIQLEGLRDIVSISSGYGSFVALKKDGTVWQYETQLPGIQDIIQVAVGGEYTYGLKEDGTVWYWGAAGIGLVNGESAANDLSPRMLEGVKDIISIQASAGGPLMLQNDGTVWASGTNSGGQLGNGTWDSSDVPVQVKGLKKVTSIAAHGVGFRSMAIRADGTLWAWGGGLVGDGKKGSRTIPVGIASYSNEIPDQDPIFVEIDGTILQVDQPPVSINNRIMVPLRAIMEALGAELEWHAFTSSITAKKGDITIQLAVNNPIASVNGKKTTLDSPPTLVNNNTLVPARFISESLGGRVTWDENEKTVTIKTGT
ncbi:stalk domain-containing protein [Paenibacillus lupini]|uniref:stalk domain-containing protein n=1 Tax=Paenibacillus lupini TaxID=1450204 RepID=UPI0014221076|nr:stalk domain-containing protein [Paenibacillus lupini]NIK20889.1 alpha-tubulin suppressor-like RCC1 family protein [Paenibacillus lupini]